MQRWGSLPLLLTKGTVVEKIFLTGFLNPVIKVRFYNRFNAQLTAAAQLLPVFLIRRK
jgi:hypothetical protein